MFNKYFVLFYRQTSRTFCFRISLKSYEERIWIIFRSAEEKYRSKRQTPIHNSEMDVIRGYLKTKGIFLREEKLPDEVEIGFENVD